MGPSCPAPPPAGERLLVPRKTESTLDEELEQLWVKHQKRLQFGDERFAHLFLDTTSRLAMHRVKVAAFRDAAGRISPDIYATANKTEHPHAKQLEKLLLDHAKRLQGEP